MRHSTYAEIVPASITPCTGANGSWATLVLASRRSAI
jgi:hypothetical protein